MANLSPRDFAQWAHATKLYGGRPYVEHLDEVVDILSSVRDGIASDDLLATVGYLHDVIEDTPVTRLFLDELFGSVKAKAVALLSDPELPSRRERKAALHLRLKHLDENDVASRAALIVKLADRLANVRACLRGPSADHLAMYSHEHVAFREAAFRAGLCSAWWDELDRTLTK